MKNMKIPDSELIVNSDGSVYHLRLKPENIADNVIIVGDQERVKRISRHFDKIEFKISHREFITHTGFFKGKRITALSTGIGPDNIDIVLNELDAAVNVDLKKRLIREKKKSLNIIRIGTSGALQPDINVDSFVISEFGLGIDGLMNFYDINPEDEEKRLEKKFVQFTKWNKRLAHPYAVEGSEMLINKIGNDMITGITVTAPGFYGPQGRIIRLNPVMKRLNEKLSSFSFTRRSKTKSTLRITNFEMETSALYGLGRALGHNCCTVCAIIANRVIGKYSADPQKAIDRLIRTALERI